MMEERYHATTQNRFYPDMSNVNKNITVQAKLISPPTYLHTAFKSNPRLPVTKMLKSHYCNTLHEVAT